MSKLAVFILAFGLILSAIFLPVQTEARKGVAINIGKIRVDEVLKPGIINILPSITVVNNGDERADYQVSVQYHSGQESDPEKGLAPPKEWFVFKPESFSLEPGQHQIVEIYLNLPINAKPGRYFAYIDARPVMKSEGRGTVIGIAAAAQLWFEIGAANIFWGIYYRLMSLYSLYTFWINLAGAVIGTAIFVALFRRFFSLNIRIKKSSAPVETGEGLADKVSVRAPKRGGKRTV